MIRAPKICVGSQIMAGLSGYVAELGAAFLCADIGISPHPRPDHAAYVDRWLKVLKADKKAIFTAASQASKAADFLAGLREKADTAEELEAAA